MKYKKVIALPKYVISGIAFRAHYLYQNIAALIFSKHTFAFFENVWITNMFCMYFFKPFLNKYNFNLKTNKSET